MPFLTLLDNKVVYSECWQPSCRHLKLKKAKEARKGSWKIEQFSPWWDCLPQLWDPQIILLFLLIRLNWCFSSMHKWHTICHVCPSFPRWISPPWYTVLRESYSSKNTNRLTEERYTVLSVSKVQRSLEESNIVLVFLSFHFLNLTTCKGGL